MANTTINKSTIAFAKALEANNNRPWFNDNKDKYVVANDNAKSFLTDLEKEMNKFDPIEKIKLYRVYRDVRFSKNKTPYNPGFRMALSREGAQNRGGYYLSIGPKDTFVACGFWAPNPADLKLIRSHIAQDAKPLEKILKAKRFKDTFGELEGEQVKTAPKGFDKEHPAIHLLRYKQMIVSRKLPNKIVCTNDLMKEVIKSYKAIRPFFDYMSDILTHDLNGVSLIK